jgi:hypothetical protein
VNWFESDYCDGYADGYTWTGSIQAQDSCSLDNCPICYEDEPEKPEKRPAPAKRTAPTDEQYPERRISL